MKYLALLTQQNSTDIIPGGEIKALSTAQSTNTSEKAIDEMALWSICWHRPPEKRKWLGVIRQVRFIDQYPVTYTRLASHVILLRRLAKCLLVSLCFQQFSVPTCEDTHMGQHEELKGLILRQCEQPKGTLLPLAARCKVTGWSGLPAASGSKLGV